MADLDIKILVKDDSQKTQLTYLFYRKDVQKDIALLRGKWARRKKVEILEDFLELHKDLTFLRKKYKLSIVFDHVLRQAILDGKITQFSRVVQIPISRKLLEELEDISDEALWQGDYEVAYVALPEAKLEEIAKIIARLKRGHKRLAKEPKKHAYKLRTADMDTKSNMDRDLKWLLLHRQGMSYKKIHELELDNGETISQSGVTRAIQNLAKKLNIDI